MNYMLTVRVSATHCICGTRVQIKKGNCGLSILQSSVSRTLCGPLAKGQRAHVLVGACGGGLRSSIWYLSHYHVDESQPNFRGCTSCRPYPARTPSVMHGPMQSVLIQDPLSLARLLKGLYTKTDVKCEL